MPNKEDSPHAILEETGVAFDPSTQHMDLSKEEKRRTTALMLAIQGYKELIIKDADYLREANIQARSEGRELNTATIDKMVEAAIKFDAFIAGQHELVDEATTGGGQADAPAPVEPPNQPTGD